MLRYDEQKVSDLQNMQYQLVNYWQQKQILPKAATELADPLQGYTLPMDPQSGAPYTYEMTGATSFKLCAAFNEPTPDTAGRGSYSSGTMSYPSMSGIDENWQHGAGDTCFTRTIDPERYLRSVSLCN